MRLLSFFSVDKNDSTFDGHDAERARVLQRRLGHDRHLATDRPQHKQGEQVEAVLVIGHDDTTLAGQGHKFFQSGNVPVLKIRDFLLIDAQRQKCWQVTFNFTRCQLVLPGFCG